MLCAIIRYYALIVSSPPRLYITIIILYAHCRNGAVTAASGRAIVPFPHALARRTARKLSQSSNEQSLCAAGHIKHNACTGRLGKRALTPLVKFEIV